MDRRVMLLLLAATALSVYTHSLVFSEWHAPTFGNTLIHVASAHHLVEHGYYPLENDYSYGGGIPNLYVPAYRFALAEAVFLTGADYEIISRLFVMAFALLVPLGFFVLGRAVFGEWEGVAAAFLASFVSDMLVYTVRPLPQGLGLALLPLAFYLLLRGTRRQALGASFAIVLVNQEVGVFFVGVAAAFFAFKAAEGYLSRRSPAIDERAETALYCVLAGVLTYVAWHFFVMGNFGVFGLIQFAQHEGNVVGFTLLLTATGGAVLALSAVGLASLAGGLRKKRGDAELFVLAMVAVGLFAIKNDAFGIGVFMDRFIVFLDIGLIVLAGFGLVALVRVCDGIQDRALNAVKRQN
ncbi:Uncharacterised protein [Candidatus Norongarragalina meridionalis]|nr:Uncharacterised protein [Candidatus Norongarragalina meridionalis]